MDFEFFLKDIDSLEAEGLVGTIVRALVNG